MADPVSLPMYLADTAHDGERSTMFLHVATLNALTVTRDDHRGSIEEDGFLVYNPTGPIDIRADIEGVLEGPQAAAHMARWMSSGQAFKVRFRGPDGTMLEGPWCLVAIQHPIPGAAMPFNALLQAVGDIVLVD